MPEDEQEPEVQPEPEPGDQPPPRGTGITLAQAEVIAAQMQANEQSRA